MKKITTLVAMMLLLFTGNALAQQAWEYDEEIVTEIIPDENHFYVLQQGFGPANVHAENLFLNSSHEKMIGSVDHSCIYNFIKVGEQEAEGEKFNIYILKNIANGQYILQIMLQNIHLALSKHSGSLQESRKRRQ